HAERLQRRLVARPRLVAGGDVDGVEREELPVDLDRPHLLDLSDPQRRPPRPLANGIEVEIDRLLLACTRHDLLLTPMLALALILAAAAAVVAAGGADVAPPNPAWHV